MFQKLMKGLAYLRTLLMMGILVVALSMLNFFLGCDTDDDPKPLYGVPPDLSGESKSPYDLIPADVYEMNEEEFRVLYGPPPQDVDVPPKDVIEDKGAEPEMMVLYGPQPVDAVEDVPAVDDDVSVVFYGPQPVDASVQETDQPEDVPNIDDDALRFLYGPQPTPDSLEE